MTKVCSKCGIEKELEKFSFRRDSGKCRNECKDCKSKYIKEYYINNKYKINKSCKKYYVKNIEKIKSSKKEYRSSNKKEIKKYRDSNKDKKKEYKINNSDKIRYNNKIYMRNKRLDPSQKILERTRTRIRNAIVSQGGYKSLKTEKLLGCSVNELKAHLEKQFQKGMDWENRGLHGWHIDHIIPCSSFDLTDPEEQKKCFHFTNLQPLWAEDNLKKSNKLNYKVNKKELK